MRNVIYVYSYSCKHILYFTDFKRFTHIPLIFSILLAFVLFFWVVFRCCKFLCFNSFLCFLFYNALFFSLLSDFFPCGSKILPKTDYFF